MREFHKRRGENIGVAGAVRKGKMLRTLSSFYYSFFIMGRTPSLFSKHFPGKKKKKENFQLLFSGEFLEKFTTRGFLYPTQCGGSKNLSRKKKISIPIDQAGETPDEQRVHRGIVNHVHEARATDGVAR